LGFFFALLFGLVSVGCVAAGAAAVGAAAASEDEDMQQIKYHINTASPPDSVARAMMNKRIVEGMSKEEVRLVMNAKRGYEAEPEARKEVDGGRQWRYWGTALYTVTFEGDKVVDYDPPTVGE
jgi:hypothetical protein